MVVVAAADRAGRADGVAMGCGVEVLVVFVVVLVGFIVRLQLRFNHTDKIAPRLLKNPRTNCMGVPPSKQCSMPGPDSAARV